MSQRARRLSIAALTIVAVAAIVLVGVSRITAIADKGSQGNRSLLEDGPTSSLTGDRITLTSSVRPFAETVRINHDDTGLVLDTTELECHGGAIDVTWHVGNLEPTSPDTGIHLVARLDGTPIGAIMRGSTRGIWNDDPAEIRASVDCPPGSHTIDLEVAWIIGDWALPYVTNPGNPPDEDLPVNRGFIVTEVWSAQAPNGTD